MGKLRMIKSIKHLLGQLKTALDIAPQPQRSMLVLAFGMVLMSLIIMPIWLYLIVTGA